MDTHPAKLVALGELKLEVPNKGNPVAEDLVQRCLNYEARVRPSALELLQTLGVELKEEPQNTVSGTHEGKTSSLILGRRRSSTASNHPESTAQNEYHVSSSKSDIYNEAIYNNDVIVEVPEEKEPKKAQQKENKMKTDAPLNEAHKF